MGTIWGRWDGLRGQQDHTFPGGCPTPGHWVLPGPWWLAGGGLACGGQGLFFVALMPWVIALQPLLSLLALPVPSAACGKAGLIALGLGDDLVFGF